MNDSYADDWQDAINERSYQDDVNTAALSELLGVTPFVAERDLGDEPARIFVVKRWDVYTKAAIVRLRVEAAQRGEVIKAYRLLMDGRAINADDARDLALALTEAAKELDTRQAMARHPSQRGDK